ncbi:MAG: amidase [Bacillus sp. (in: firmicutes)]
MKFSEYATYDGIGLAELVRRKEVTPEELKDVALRAVEKINPIINAVVATYPNRAMEDMKQLTPNAPFFGVPYLLKETSPQAVGIPSCMGSRLAEGYTTSEDSELVIRFRKAGLVLLGTTTTPEVQFNFSTESIMYGPTRNPWNLQLSAGGSSGGSAAAVAAGIVPIAQGNDGAGSIRQPASVNGLVGLKPTRSRVPFGPTSSEPLNGLASNFALTRSVRDAAALLDAVGGADIGCYSSPEIPKRPYLTELENTPKKLRIAWMSKPINGAPVDQECIESLHQTVQLCRDLGHELVEDAPVIDNEALFLATFRIWAANISRNLETVAKVLNRKPSIDNMENVSWSAYQYYKTMKASDLLEALSINNTISREVGLFFTKYDVLLTPTTARLPVPLGVLNMNAPGIDIWNWTKQILDYSPFTYLFNTTGQPAISLPLGWSKEGLPIGMQFVGRFGDETTLFRLAGQLEQASPWKEKRPLLHEEEIPLITSQGE